MGNKHPLSLKLKKQKRWLSIIYKYTEGGSLSERNKQKIINKIIIQKYKERLISKPIYEYTSKSINVWIYEYWREMAKGERELMIEEEREGRERLERCIRERMGTEIKINLRGLRGVVLDSNIVGVYFRERLKWNSVNRARARVRRLTFIEYKEKGNVEKDQYKWTEIKKKDMNKRIKSLIYGIKVEIKGRISKKRRIRRSMKKRLRIGRLEYNTISNIIDYNQTQAIGVQGVYNIRVGLSTRLVRGTPTGI